MTDDVERRICEIFDVDPDDPRYIAYAEWDDARRAERDEEVRQYRAWMGEMTERFQSEITAWLAEQGAELTWVDPGEPTSA